MPKEKREKIFLKVIFYPLFWHLHYRGGKTLNTSLFKSGKEECETPQDLFTELNREFCGSCLIRAPWIADVPFITSIIHIAIHAVSRKRSAAWIANMNNSRAYSQDTGQNTRGLCALVFCLVSRRLRRTAAIASFGTPRVVLEILVFVWVPYPSKDIDTIPRRYYVNFDNLFTTWRQPVYNLFTTGNFVNKL